MKVGFYRGFKIEEVTEDKYAIVSMDMLGGMLAPVVSFLQAVHSIDHYLDRSCEKHKNRDCPGRFLAGSKPDQIIVDEMTDFQLTEV